MTSDPRVIVALDFPDAKGALALAKRIDPKLCRVKVGKELYTAAGPSLVEKLQQSGFGVFLDLKFHDIPNTVAGACLAAARLGVWMVNVHALGGRAMMTAAREALASMATRPKLTAVTVLTSMGPADMTDIGLSGSPRDAVLRLAGLAKECGLDGVVCSPQEAAELRQQFGREFDLVTPGIRPAEPVKHERERPKGLVLDFLRPAVVSGRIADDQKRIATPREAIESGADYIVIGRPITRAPDPLAALREIHAEITG
jgi:orotidine-5'-phosphate decarboxylase